MKPRNLLLPVLLLGWALTLTACGSQNVTETSSDAVSSQTVGESAVSQEESNPFGRLAGNWCVDGDSGAAHLEITGDGRFTTYYASGATETEGYIVRKRNGEMAQTDYSFHFYTDEGKLYFSIPDLEEEECNQFDTISEFPLHFERIS